MQSITIAMIIIAFELVLLPLAGFSFLWFRRGSGRMTRGGRGVMVAEYKHLAHRLARTHGILMTQYAALTREFTPGDTDNEAFQAAEAGMRKSIEQLRLAASQLALGIAEAEQISLDLLGAQESLLVAFDACTRIGQFRNGSESGSSAANGQPPDAEKLPAQDLVPAEENPLTAEGMPDPQPEQEALEEVLEPAPLSPPPASEPVTKTEGDLQAEIDALMRPPASESQREELQSREPRREESQPEEPPRKMTEAEIEAEMQAELDAMMAGSQPAAPPLESGLQTEIIEGKIPGSALPEPPQRKMTEAEIEAEMQAELEAMLAASQAAAPAPPVDPQAEIDALLGQNYQDVLVAEPENISEEEIEAGIQAELEALLAPGWQAKPEQKSPDEDLQAEIDALLGVELEPPKTEIVPTPAAVPAAPEQAANDLDLQAEIDALLAAESREPSETMVPPVPKSSKITQGDLDLQAEIDALLEKEAEKPDLQDQNPPTIKLSQGDLDLQAEIDALMAREQAEPESPAHKALQEISRQSGSLAVSPSFSSAADLQAEIDALLGADASVAEEAGELTKAAPAASPHSEGKLGKNATDDLQAEIDALFSSAGK